MYQLFCLLGSRTRVSYVRVNNSVGMLYHFCCERNEISNFIVVNKHILKHDVFLFQYIGIKKCINITRLFPPCICLCSGNKVIAALWCGRYCIRLSLLLNWYVLSAFVSCSFSNYDWHFKKDWHYSCCDDPGHNCSRWRQTDTRHSRGR